MSKMKEKQVLSTEQMQHLQELGLNINDTDLVVSRYTYQNGERRDWIVEERLTATVGFDDAFPRDSQHYTFTLLDILKRLPRTINDLGYVFYPWIDLTSEIIRYSVLDDSGNYQGAYLEYFSHAGEPFIDDAYELLVECLVRKYVEQKWMNNEK